MSRSIHTTRSTFRRIARTKFRSEEEREAVFDQAGVELSRKRAIKRDVKGERRKVEAPLAGTPVSTIPIETLDEGPFIHHAVTEKDVRAVLSLLPSAATEGITGIQLRLGKQSLDEREHSGEKRDPWTGRHSAEILPNVYAGTILGTFHFATGRIFLHAYVYDPQRLPLPRELCELYLTLQALGTLVHEVAHHHDRIRRRARGRWRMDRKENYENYAEKMQTLWTREIVLPYLERTRRSSVARLLKWVAHRGGARVPFEFFASNGQVFFSTAGAFEGWVTNLHKCRTLIDSRLAFAEEIHYADQYDTCLQILDNILSSQPNHTEALIWKADTLDHLERYDEGMAAVESALAQGPKNSRAWMVRGALLKSKQDWLAMMENCERWEATLTPKSRDRFDSYRHRAVACCALGRKEELERLMDLLLNFGGRKRSKDLLVKRIYHAAGQPLPVEFVTAAPKRPRIR